MARNPTAIALMALVALCVVLRGAHILYERHAPWTAFESEQIAHNLVEGRGFTYEYYGKLLPAANAPPGLVFALVPIYASGVRHPELWFRFFQAVLSAASLVLMWQLARRAFDRRAAWVAAGLFLVDLNLSFSVLWIQETALTIFFTLAGLCALVALRDRPGWGWTALTGLLFGLGILVRPTLGIVFVASLGWFIFSCRSDEEEKLPAAHSQVPGSNRWLLAIGAAVVAVLVLAPWTYRNYRVFGRFVPVSQNLGLSLWYGNNPRATGSQVDSEGRDLEPEKGSALWNRLVAAQSEVEINRAYLDAALEFIREHPAQSLVLRAKCFAYFWLDHNYWLVEPRFPVSWRIKTANITLVAVFAVALALNWRRGGTARLLLVVIVATCLTYTMIHADVGNRYRVQIEPLMLTYVGQLAVQVVDWIRGR